MNWEAAIARNREALLEIVLALMASVGLQPKGMLTTLPFYLYRKALFTIRVAETAVRRLIFIAAHDLKLRGFELAKPRSGVPLSPRGEGRVRGLCNTPKGQVEAFFPLIRPVGAPSPQGEKEASPSFKPLSKGTKITLIGGALPLPSGAPASGLPLKGGAENNARGQGEGAFGQLRMLKVQAQSSTPKFQLDPFFRRYPRATHPRISFPLIEPLKTFTEDPRDFSWLNHDDKSFSRQPTPAFNLGNRLLALHFALTNIDRQARRLLRWEARRDAALKQNRPHRMTPMRPGLPPFYARKPTTEIEKILKECHGLTHYARDNEAFLTKGGVP